MKIIITESTYKLIHETISLTELNPDIKRIKANFGETYYNYITSDGVEVTLTLNPEPGYLNNEQVDGDFGIEAIGSEKRGAGLASRELKKIVEFADNHNYSISLVVDPEGATTNSQGVKFAETGLSAEQLKNWYSRYGFLFDKKSNFGYRPKASEKENFLNKRKTIQIPINQIQIDKIEGISDPETLQNLLSMGELEENIIYEDGDDNLYLFKNGELLEIDNVEAHWNYEIKNYELKEK